MEASPNTLSEPCADAVQVPLEDWQRSVEAFTRMIDRLQADYAELERRHASLNSELAVANEALRASSDGNRRLATYLDRIVAGVTSGIIAVDAHGVVQLFNPAAASVLGVAAEDVIGRHYYDVWPSRKDDMASAAACAAGADPVNWIRREISRNGVRGMVISVSTARLDFHPGNGDASGAGIGGAIEVFSDVTQVETMQSEMARMRTLAALGEMSATVAHEIRNPLGGISGFAELLARKAEHDPDLKDMTSNILTGARHLNGLVERLLEFAREPRVEKRPLDWNRFLGTTVDQFAEASRHRGARLRFVRRVPESLPPGHGDGLCLRQAIWNILENAEHATGGSGIVEIEAQPQSGGLRLRITDNGGGIDPRIADRVFAPFTTTKTRGTGLGLATCKKLIEAHGGQIAITSQPGNGTTVQVDLP
ncbi:MAG: PAS domain-containing protein [candidate division Zixibacteria bacterium]|nr:PAS domain-containing protein [candidate division Zixibacteria bacterium]